MGDMNMSGKRELMEYVPNYIVYDLETTGFSCNYDKIIEIAAIKVEGGKLADEFSALVNPERSIPYDASSVNGITDNMVKDAPKITISKVSYHTIVPAHSFLSVLPVR